MTKPDRPPSPFDTWEECRDYYALEAIFLGQHYDRNRTTGRKRRYMKAARLAIAANQRCKKPLPMEVPS